MIMNLKDKNITDKFTKICEAPKSGKAMVYFKTRVFYGEYSIDGTELELKDAEDVESDILELHLFDEKTEYRAVCSQMAENGYIEAIVADAGQVHDKIVQEECYLLEEYDDEKIGVANYLKYNEDDMLELVNYRLYTI